MNYAHDLFHKFGVIKVVFFYRLNFLFFISALILSLFYWLAFILLDFFLFSFLTWRHCPLVFSPSLTHSSFLIIYSSSHCYPLILSPHLPLDSFFVPSHLFTLPLALTHSHSLTLIHSFIFHSLLFCEPLTHTQSYSKLITHPPHSHTWPLTNTLSLNPSLLSFLSLPLYRLLLTTDSPPLLNQSYSHILS